MSYFGQEFGGYFGGYFGAITADLSDIFGLTFSGSLITADVATDAHDYALHIGTLAIVDLATDAHDYALRITLKIADSSADVHSSSLPHKSMPIAIETTPMITQLMTNDQLVSVDENTNVKNVANTAETDTLSDTNTTNTDTATTEYWISIT